MIQKVNPEYNILSKVYSAMESVEKLEITYKNSKGQICLIEGYIHYIDFKPKELRLIDLNDKLHYIGWLSIMKIINKTSLTYQP